MTDHEHVHEGDHPHDHEHDHEHAAQEANFSPQAVPMSTRTAIVPLSDGTDRVVATFNSVNGQWVVFFDRDGAIEFAKTLLALAHTPPQEVEREPVVEDAVLDLEPVAAPN